MSFDQLTVSGASASGARTRLTFVVFGFVAVSGALIQIRGALMSSFQDSFLVSESQLGLLTPVSTIGFTAAIILFGLFAGRLDARRAMSVGIALTGLALFALGFAPFFLLLLLVEGFRNFATGIFRALDRPVLSHLYTDSRGRILSLVGMVWALGAAAGPVFATVVMSVFGHSWQVVYFLLALVCVPLAILLVRQDFSGFEGSERSFAVNDLRRVARKPRIHTMTVSLVLVGGIESGFFTWLPYYISQSYAQSTANLSLSVYLISYIPGRFGFSYLTSRYRNLNLLVASTLILPIVLWLTLRVFEGTALLVSIFAVGLLMSGLFPTLITIGMDAVPSFSGPVNAMGNFSARIGFFIVPALIGVLAQVYTIQAAMGVQIALGAALTATILLFKMIESRSKTAAH